MGDAAPPNLDSSSPDSIQQVRLPEQGESSTSTQAQSWTPIPTAFDTVLPVAMDIVEDEAPSRPLTPSQDLADDAGSRADGGDINLQAATSSERTTKRPQAKSNCMCKIATTAKDPSDQLKHYNSCWAKLYQTLVDKGRIAKRTAIPRAPASVCILCHANLDKYAAADAHEHRLICIRNWRQDPAPCPSCGLHLASDGVSQSVTRKAKHLYDCSIHPRMEFFQAVHEEWLDRQDRRKDTGNCPFCLISLRGQNLVDALSHRINCFDRKTPTRCPICFKNFPPVSAALRLQKGLALLHVRDCQHGGELPPFDFLHQSQAFDHIAVRTRLVWALLDKHMIGSRKGWSSREHSHSFRAKRDAGRRNPSGLYLTPCTKLRKFAIFTEDDYMTLVEKTRSRREVWCNLERFRRSAFCVYKIPKDELMVEGRRSEKETCRTVHTCCEDRSSPAFDRVKRMSTCEDVRLAAVDPARQTGLRIPPGFEPNNSKP